MDKMIDTRLYPHGPYAMGALDYLSDVIVYCINVSTNKPPSRWLILLIGVWLQHARPKGMDHGVRPGVTSRTRKKQVCPCLTLFTAPTCSCVFVRVVLSKKKPKKKGIITHQSNPPSLYKIYILYNTCTQYSPLLVRRAWKSARSHLPGGRGERGWQDSHPRPPATLVRRRLMVCTHCCTPTIQCVLRVTCPRSALRYFSTAADWAGPGVTCCVGRPNGDRGKS